MKCDCQPENLTSDEETKAWTDEVFDEDSKSQSSELNQGGLLVLGEQVSPQSFLNPELALLWVNKSKNYGTEEFYLPKSTNSPYYLKESFIGLHGRD